MKEQSIRMTEGAPWRHIVRFAAPVFLGHLFQQLYNVVDSLVVGNYLGETSLAAVVSSSFLIQLLTALVLGTFTGASVVIARYWGARDDKGLESAVHTTVAFGVASGLGMSLMGVILSPILLRWMGTPENVLPLSVSYFRIYFAGSIFSVMYNTAAGIHQAVGDARFPLRMLILSSGINVVLDILFIRVFGMNVEGAAYATIISQAIAAYLAMSHLMKVSAPYRVRWRRVRFERNMLSQILKMGLPTGLQSSIISIANVVVQSSINSFGELAMAGCGSYSKLEGFGFLPINAFALALSTFVGQNLGAGKPERARQGARFGILACVITAESIGLIFRGFAPQLVALFNRSAEVVAFGTAQARTVTAFYFLLAFSHATAGVMRGAGRAVVPMLVMMLCWCVIRVTYILTIARPSGSITMVFWAYPISWSLSSIIFLLYLLLADWTGQKKALMKAEVR